MLFNIFTAIIYAAHITVCLAEAGTSEPNEHRSTELSLTVSRDERFLFPQYQWASWTNWAQYQCSVSCGGGTIQRHKQCVISSNGVTTSEGNCASVHFGYIPRETNQCNTQQCGGPHWLEWNPWSACSRSCGRGIRSRTRSCENPLSDGRMCEGDRTQNSGCANSCQAWSHCSGSCGFGVKIRTRTCTNQDLHNSTHSCQGDPTQKQTCNHGNVCPADGHWSDWSRWSGCSHTCGDGSMSRTRSCDNPKPSNGGQQCHGSSSETHWCHVQACPTKGWTAWGAWSHCSGSCGTGIQMRLRTCSQPNTPECSGEAMERNVCLHQNMCPDTTVGKGWSEWGAWSHCSGSCGTGIQLRRRTCSRPGTPECSGEDMQRKVCLHQKMCPVQVTTKTSSIVLSTSKASSIAVPLYKTSSTILPTSKASSALLPTSKVSSIFPSTHKPLSSVSKPGTVPVVSTVVSSMPSTVPPCADHTVCTDPKTKQVACTNTYIANTYCPKLCGLCGSTNAPGAVKCQDKAGPKCKEALYRMFACSDKDLSHLCEQTCNICH